MTTSLLEGRISGPITASCLVLAVLLIVVLPAAAATQYVEVTKYRANNYSAVENSQNLSWTQMQANFTNVYSKGHVYFQGPTFNASDPYGIAGENMIDYYEHNGTYVRNLTDLVGGMTAGDEIAVKATDGMTRRFNYTNVYEPYDDGTYAQGDMILAWWDNVYGPVPGYSEGIRLFFYDPPATYGLADSLNMTLMDMYKSMAPWYRYNYSGIWPSAKGLSVKYVNQLKIYPPHRHDFNTTGDTNEWAYEGGVSGVPGTASEPSTAFTSTSAIADDDGTSYQTNSETIGEYAAQRFVFGISETVANIEKLAITWDGSSSNGDLSADQGATTYIWKNGVGYETYTGEISSGISNYVVGGNVTLLVKQNAVTSIGEEEETLLSRIFTDYVKIVVTYHNI